MLKYTKYKSSKLLFFLSIIFSGIGCVSESKTSNSKIEESRLDSVKQSTALQLPQNTEFEVWQKSAFTNGLDHPQIPTLTLRVKISETIKSKFFKMTASEKIKMLENDSSDFVTNLLLYEEYKQEAYLYMKIINNRSAWLPIKEQDIEKWKKLLQ